MEKFGKELELIVLLAGYQSLTVQEIADRLGVSPRNLYYYFDYLRRCGFKFIKTGFSYSLDRTTSFFTRLHESIPLNSQEAEYVLKNISDYATKDATAAAVKMKLERHFNLVGSSSREAMKKTFRNVNTLRRAMNDKKVVVLTGYSSPHSRTVTDRIVEPFLFLNNEADIRCYEIKSHENKTFKISRIDDVQIMDIGWFNERRHREVFTDVFSFSGEERHHVEVRLGQLARNLLVEEYPLAETCITDCGEGVWTFSADVVSYVAAGRFVLGLYDDVTVVGDDGFKAFLAEKIAKMKVNVGKMEDKSGKMEHKR